MKTISFTLLFALGLGGTAVEVQAQASQRKVDSLLLADHVEGEYRVKQYLVQEPEDADYAIHYRINNATLNRALDKNGAALDELNQLVEERFSDTLNRVERIHITGYASPDGPMALNTALAKRRVADMKSYVDKHYNFSKRYDVELDAEVPAWGSIRAAVAGSSIPHRDSVLQILDGNHSENDKQAALKRMPEVWDYLATHILPPLRRVEVDVAYARGLVVEQRTLVPKPAPAPAPVPEPQPEVVIVEEIEEVVDPCRDEFCRSEQVGIILDMPYEEVDY